MHGRLKAARVIIGLGCFILLAAAGLHLAAAYPRVSTGIAASNLDPGLQSALRAVFLLIGWDWIVLAVIVGFAAFTDTRISKTLVTFCGAALLVQTALMERFLGWFVGSEMICASALLILCGGLTLAPVQSRGEALGEKTA
jgi:glucose-6-phosphate-specific signal transduction histidine kinase